MAQDKELTFKRLGEIWKSNEFPAIETAGNRLVIFSDLHLGDGKGADDFRENAETMLAALAHYREAGYRLILAGDVEDLWQFAVPEVAANYGDSVYRAMTEFGDENTFRIFGNHDSDWRILPDPAKKAPYLPAEPAEALKLKDAGGAVRILVVHGHQGSLDADRNAWSSRFAVRAFRLIEPFLKRLGIIRHAPAIKCEVMRDYERIMYSWAKANKVLLICGHSHNAIFASLSYADRLNEKMRALRAEIRGNRGDRGLVREKRRELGSLAKQVRREAAKKRDILPAEAAAEAPLPCYFNSGCGIYDDGVTAIEIVDGKIRLAKWHREPGAAARYEIYQEGDLAGYLDAIANA